MTGSKDIGKKPQKSLCQNGGFHPQMGHKFKNFQNLLIDSSTKSYEVSLIQNSKYLDKFFITFVLMNYTKKYKNDSLKNKGLATTKQLEPHFSWTCGFCKVLDNV